MSKIGVFVAAVLSLSAMAVGVYGWIAMGNVPMSPGGILAMILGGVATLALGAGLMALVFYSHRKGFDDAAVTRPQTPKERSGRP